MYRKIIAIVIILILAGVGSWWLMQKNNSHPFAKGYDPALDTIFFNITFGMPKQAFLDTCWKLNKTEDFEEGGNALSIQHLIKKGYSLPVYMNFFPDFTERGLYKIPIVYHYESWAPWNRQLFSDSLIIRIAENFEKDYHIKLTKKKTEDGRPAYYNYSGLRKILLTTQDDQYVKVLMENERYK
jgi:hypothetical protein